MANEGKLRKQVNSKLADLGSRYHCHIPLGEIDEILTDSGFRQLEPAIYCGRQGQVHEQVGEKSWINLAWYRMEVSGNYEITAYVS